MALPWTVPVSWTLQWPVLNKLLTFDYRSTNQTRNWNGTQHNQNSVDIHTNHFTDVATTTQHDTVQLYTTFHVISMHINTLFIPEADVSINPRSCSFSAISSIFFAKMQQYLEENIGFQCSTYLAIELQCQGVGSPWRKTQSRDLGVSLSLDQSMESLPSKHMKGTI